MARWPNEAQKAASLIWIGAPKSKAARIVGCTDAQLAQWTKSEWWPDCLRQVEAQHFETLLGKARRVLVHVMDTGLLEDATARDRKQALDAARFLLDRRDPAFAPPGTVHEHRHTVQQLAPLEQLSVEELRALARGRALPPVEVELPPLEDFIDVEVEPSVKAPYTLRTNDEGEMVLDESGPTIRGTEGAGS